MCSYNVYSIKEKTKAYNQLQDAIDRLDKYGIKYHEIRIKDKDYILFVSDEYKVSEYDIKNLDIEIIPISKEFFPEGHTAVLMKKIMEVKKYEN